MPIFHPLILSLAILIALCVSEVIPKVWFTSSPLINSSLKLSIQPGTKSLPLDNTRAEESLFYDHGKKWIIPEINADPTKTITFFKLDYDAGNGRLWADIFGHSPAMCLPKSGAQLTAPSRKLNLSAIGNNISGAAYTFSYPENSSPLFIYKCVWLPSFSGSQLDQDIKTFEDKRFQMLTHRISAPPASAIFAIVEGVFEEEQADSLFSKYVLAHLQILPHTTSSSLK